MKQIKGFIKYRRGNWVKVIALGDYIYYVYNGDTIPGQVTALGRNRVKIHGNFLEGDRETWVSPFSLEAQQ